MNYLTLCPPGLVLRTFGQYLMTYFSRPESANDINSDIFVRSVVLEKRLKFRDPILNCSREILPEAVAGGSFYSIFTVAFYRK